MTHKLTIKAFFFNAKTDYLPYYKNFTLNVEGNLTAKNLLELIQEKNSNFSYPQKKLIIKINEFIVEAKEPVENIVENLGTELTIEPANTYRSNNGLKINDDDFIKSYALLEPYATESDFKYYKTLYALHYASETEKFDHEYIGDAILVLAYKMISEGNEHKTEILNAITSVNSGLLDCEYENNLLNAQHHTSAITALKEMVKNDDNEYPSLWDMIKTRFFNTEKLMNENIEKPQKETMQIIDDLNSKNIAYYAGETTNRVHLISQMIIDMGSKEIAISRVHKLSGFTLLEDNKTLAFKKAGATLLDAFDAGSEVLIIENLDTYMMMRTHFKKIENTIGRKIIGLELVLAEDFISQVSKLAA